MLSFAGVPSLTEVLTREPRQPAPGEPASPESSAPNLYGFASRAWISGLLDPKKIAGPEYFGKTSHKEGEMVGFVNDTLSGWSADDVTAQTARS